MYTYEPLIIYTDVSEEKLKEVTKWANAKRQSKEGLTIDELCEALGGSTNDVWGCTEHFDCQQLGLIVKRFADLWGWDKNGFCRLYGRRYTKVRL